MSGERASQYMARSVNELAAETPASAAYAQVLALLALAAGLQDIAAALRDLGPQHIQMPWPPQ